MPEGMLRKTYPSTGLRIGLAMLLLGFGGVALHQNVVKLPGLYPMFHTQLTSLALIALVVGPKGTATGNDRFYALIAGRHFRSTRNARRS